ncbi:hypothetical protein SGR_7137t [Streptomyces griseus subsp. griseus NBRC 13350]|uniref:Uncharacterized protein n=1 Tax=Streptomyces griseus subsp. griseus (strain JCM 4626 / CBS 651.72 / NBRC 13350 / KCC S-0626 / ISP 5235) TaxID=455632 RepID=B1VKK0_STRGG|nr:hypothetical protein SGR_2t [Streptomyces griseus subsp. griseus NBRC 13350]BAG23964.1 hypothetical protein SGR_7137t [Streptomyces griseus subsp. griseus NBRC 13350]
MTWQGGSAGSGAGTISSRAAPGVSTGLLQAPAICLPDFLLRRLLISTVATMTLDDPTAKVREVMLVERPIGTRLSRSRTPGGNSALARDDDNSLVTHAVLYPTEAFTAEEVVKIVGATAALAATAGIAVGAVAMKAGPRVKSTFSGLRSKLTLKAEEVTAAAAEQVPEQPGT